MQRIGNLLFELLEILGDAGEDVHVFIRVDLVLFYAVPLREAGTHIHIDGFGRPIEVFRRDADRLTVKRVTRAFEFVILPVDH